MAAATILFQRLALQEYRTAYHWYQQRSQQAAQDFRDEVDQVLQRIADNPLQGTAYRRLFRWVRTRRFPYILYYRLVVPDIVLIMAVAHVRRRPGYWLRRKGL